MMIKTFTRRAAAVFLAFAACAVPAVWAQDNASELGDGPVPLEEFRRLALQNNKQLMIARTRIKKAEYQNKEAFAAYLPAIDFAGGYLYNQKNISLLNSADYLQPIGQAYLAGVAAKYPHLGQTIQGLMQDPQTAPIVNEALGIANDLVGVTNNTLRKSTSFDIHNVFFGAITLTQPVFMGGKIVAMNKITHAARNAAIAMHDSEAENVIYAVDAAYWLVVSLKAKEKLATSFVNLLDSLSRNVNLMVREGVATRSDALSVEVKLNEAQVDLTKVQNGLVLSRMALAQVCGLPVDAQPRLADEDSEETVSVPEASDVVPADMQTVFDNRPDLRALTQGIEVARQEANVAKASMMPQLALVGAYQFSNPNMYNGFEKKFNGAFSVGAMLTVPLWHWGGNYNKYRAAKCDRIAMELQLQDAQELVTLQVRQASFKNKEADKTYRMTRTNLQKADENLRTATLAFKEGVATSDNVLEAQTAWLKAHSENIDAAIDVRLCRVYLSKVLGNLYNSQQ